MVARSTIAAAFVPALGIKLLAWRLSLPSSQPHPYFSPFQCLTLTHHMSHRRSFIEPIHQNNECYFADESNEECARRRCVRGLSFPSPSTLLQSRARMCVQTGHDK